MSYQPPPRLAWFSEYSGDTGAVRLTLMHLPNGAPMLLDGTSALIWLLACDGADVPRSLADLLGQPEMDIAVDTEAFLSDLVARNLLRVESS